MYKTETPSNINAIIKDSFDKNNYKIRLNAVEELGKWKCSKSINRLLDLMKHDKIYSIKQNAFLKLQHLGEPVKLPKKKKGHLIKDINKKILKVYNSFQSASYSLTDFKIKFKEQYPEAYDVYLYEKNVQFDNWIASIVKHSPMKRLKNKYIVQIQFKTTGEKKEIYRDSIGYKGSIEKSDSIVICNNEILITADRSAIISPKNILDNESNTINTQITKGLLFYYLYFKKYVEILSIVIKREKNTTLEEFQLPNSNTRINQVLDTSFLIRSDIEFDISQLKVLFENNEKSIALYNAISYLLKANITVETSGKFEKLWKAFNSIYRYFGNGKNENDCHRIIRKHIIYNSTLFGLSKANVNRFDSTSLRKLRLRDLILNDYATKNLTVSFLSFIFRYSDHRVCQLLRETLVYREEYIKDILSIEGVESKFNKLSNITFLYSDYKRNPTTNYIYNKVVEYLDNHIAHRTISDVELVAFICIKYSYYVRNKIFHAEKHDLSFRLIDNNLTEELDWLNVNLETLVMELIKSNSNWIQEI
ncbi:MAG: hypothetical protein Q8861_10820 [Bacteroidota bacterium]|nr:hypothetical protein [Bacteroidota bacterium]